jgi:hypothetical protein
MSGNTADTNDTTGTQIKGNISTSTAANAAAGVHSAGNNTLSGGRITGNTASGSYGGLYSSKALVGTGTVISGNTPAVMCINGTDVNE